MSRADEVRANLAEVEQRINAACARAGRKREDVLLVAVTKTFPATDVDAAIAAGVTTVGENKVQEGRDKKPLVTATAQWHLVGHLQSNKAKDAVRLFDVIQTIDSTDLAAKISRHAEAAGKTQDVLLQVNIGNEEQKSGADVDVVEKLATGVAAMPSIRILGVMAIPPAGEAEAMRPHFRKLKALRDSLGLEHVSMGMTDDFEVAIEEGSTIVRIGRAIFGSRT